MTIDGNKLIKDCFDSSILELNAYKLYINSLGFTAVDYHEIVKEIVLPYMICCVTVFDYENMSTLQEMGYNLISTKSTYFKRLPEKTERLHKQENEPFRIIPRSTFTDVSWEQVSGLAKEIAIKGRLAKDRQIAPQKAYEMYEVWVKNSLFHKYAEEVFFAMDGSKPIGFVSLKVKSDRVIIDLIVVDPQYQGRGIGRALLAASDCFACELGLCAIEVETEAENIAANVLYQRNGYRVVDFKLVYHKSEIL